MPREDATTLPEFNPTQDSRVAAIKQAGEQFLQAVRENANPGWRKDVALEQAEIAAMLAVKSLFTQ